jgi:hypothetical protein
MQHDLICIAGTAKISDFGMARFKLSAALVTKQPDAGTVVSI